MAQSKKYTIPIEKVLKEYPYICWRINNQQSSLNKELKQMGIRKESIEFLKNIFFQNSDIKKFYDCEQELYYLTEIKKMIDIALERLEAYPKKGKQLYDIINAIYFREYDVADITVEKIYKIFNKNLEDANERTFSFSTFKGRRKEAIELMQSIITSYFNTTIK